MEHVTHRGLALDLGAGALAESKYLLNQGFQKVIAVDSEPLVRENAPKDARLEVHISSFEDFEFPSETFDLVNAQYSLPFTNPEKFQSVFTSVKDSLKSGGVFVLQLFGDKDGWNDRPGMTFLSKNKVNDLISDMEIIHFEEEEQDKKTASGYKKHWHLFRLTFEPA